jgi:hypothetical protein
MQEGLDETVRIQTILSDYIAIERRRKGTFYLLEWVNEPRGWQKYTGEGFPDLMRHKSINHIYTDILMPIRMRRRVGLIALNKRGYGSGEFLKSGDTVIPIIVANLMPATMIGTEFVARRAVDYDSAQELWIEQTVQPEPLPPPRPRPQPQPQPQPVPVALPDPIPLRIARLIAEDSKDENCPITMNKITPFTCSVTSCFHVFDSDALDEWTTTNNTCPVCRKLCSVTAVGLEL